MKIISESTFVGAWKVLKQQYENKTAYEPQHLYRRLSTFKINSASEVSTGVSEITGIFAQLRNLEEEISEHFQIGTILSALPSSFDIFVTVWNNSATNDVESLVAKLMAEAAEQVSKGQEDVKALVVRAEGKKVMLAKINAGIVRRPVTGLRIAPISRTNVAPRMNTAPTQSMMKMTWIDSASARIGSHKMTSIT